MLHANFEAAVSALGAAVPSAEQRGSTRISAGNTKPKNHAKRMLSLVAWVRAWYQSWAMVHDRPGISQ